MNEIFSNGQDRHTKPETESAADRGEQVNWAQYVLLLKMIRYYTQYTLINVTFSPPFPVSKLY